ncbi:LytTR family DNA-binding domain-containing protein [Cytophagaceae bacterium DM2B3-1]|uniref:LytTR family DNA-binding domain-containing protein n=1 Tax=Xanthocytophaga flava TaxID=3048013 RepID=A0ABT7CP58_9BACT|nr:LytTR family DNA-binding domain-containing protein [Xanthocytophaga flavus]MDJ1495523.1 LytTR family DNA-binding domain-containing protein [Xanthocytophaga flavus]
MLTILIIEDEIKAARELQKLLEELQPGCHIIAILQSVEEAIHWLKNNSVPDLIFSDIQLADGLCFDIFKTVRLHSPIIFCTAFDEYAIRAFETNSIDYLLKPIDKVKLGKSLDKYDSLKQIYSGNKEYEAKLEALFSQIRKPYKTSLLVHFKEKIIPLKTEEIAFFHYTNGIVHVLTQRNQQHVINYTLDELEAMVDPQVFYRANRQFIINRNAISNAEHYFARKLTVKLHIPTPEPIVISKAKASDFLHWLEHS